jgi:hypothetical protein
MTRESDIDEYLQQKCAAIGALVRKIQYRGRNSCPDVLVAYGGAHFCELKKPGKKPREDQVREIRRLNKQRCSVWVLTSHADVDRFINTIRYLRG